jgi:hypothetical protein
LKLIAFFIFLDVLFGSANLTIHKEKIVLSKIYGFITFWGLDSYRRQDHFYPIICVGLESAKKWRKGFIIKDWLTLLGASVQVFWTSVEGPCLHRSENWLMGQLIDLKAKASIQSRIY